MKSDLYGLNTIKNGENVKQKVRMSSDISHCE